MNPAMVRRKVSGETSRVHAAFLQVTTGALFALGLRRASGA